MAIQLTGDNEPRGLYRDFYGSPLGLMPILIERGLEPISVAGVINRRESAPADVIDKWRYNYFFTSDGAACDERKNVKLVLDAALLLDINPDTKLTRGAMVLSNDQWEELHGDNVLYLSADKVNQAQEKGFVKINGVWQPKNSVVGEIWNHLSRGKDLKEYAQMVGEVFGCKRIMQLWFDNKNYDSPVMWSLGLGSIDVDSIVFGSNTINGILDGRLVGVAPEVQGDACKRAALNGGPYRTSASVSQSELEAVLDEFKMADPTELRKALQLYGTQLKTKKA